jgi:hypothetical protein
MRIYGEKPRHFVQRVKRLWRSTSEADAAPRDQPR